jgi:hypothetical protein
MCAKRKNEGRTTVARARRLNAKTPTTVGVLLDRDLQWAILGSNQ